MTSSLQFGTSILRFLFAACLLAFLPSSVLAGHWYQCCQDIDRFFGYEGVIATIEVVPTTLADHVSVWCGIDDGLQAMWIQVGWIDYPSYASPKAYYEFVPESGHNNRVFQEVATASTGSYEISRSGLNLNIKINGVVVAQQSWSDFDARLLCDAVYGAEIHSDPGDHIPGVPAAPCDFTNIQVKSVGWGWSSATLLSTIQTSSCGKLSRSGNSMSIWDERTLTQTNCP